MSQIESEIVGWAGTLEQFMGVPNDTLLKSLSSSVSLLNLGIGESQTRAWVDSIRVLKREYGKLLNERPDANHWGILLEYQLPRERGRRPDVVILSGSKLSVIEFKGRLYAEQADIDQAAAYSRDLHEYHALSHDLGSTCIVSLDDANVPSSRVEDVTIVGGRLLSRELASIDDDSECSLSYIQSWIDADYRPLPSLVNAARRIFEHEPLPRIRRATSAGVPKALATLQAAANTAREKKERHIAFVSGVPGSGKTLVGLQFVYQTLFSDDESRRPAVFLSGNGPLVDVLQHALKSRVFVQAVHGFLKTYGGIKNKRRPEEHIWVYDKAQRAWDAERVKSKRGHDLSEHADFVQLGLRMPDWSMLVGLIGSGQEIYLGEEGGIGLWNTAIADSGAEWVVHCCSRLAPVFSSADRVVIDESLDLNVTLRAHCASELHAWVNALLDGDLARARELSVRLRRDGFRLYLTRDLDEAKQYVRSRYESTPDARYGLLGSSKSKILGRFGLDASFQATRSFRPGPWFNNDPFDKASCCQLDRAASEFGCQGLELDFPIVGWDNDLTWDLNRWVSKQTKSPARDAHQLRINSYRVLLTRGRDGMIIFVPELPTHESIAAALLEAGSEQLRLKYNG